MMAENKHVFLINEKANNPKFNRQRGRKPNENQQPEESPQPKVIKDFQKERLRNDHATFYTQRKNRNETRTIQFPKVIDLVRILFFTVFNYDLNKKFNERYGLSPVEYSSFNKTVTFEVINEKLFKNFEDHVTEVINSADETSYENKSFNLIALILKFEFISSGLRLLTSKETGILLTLISSANAVYSVQKEALINYLQEQQLAISYNSQFPDIVEIRNILKEQNKFIADNFDIVRIITSTRALKIRPGSYGAVRREFGFTVDVPENITTVGVIDTGVSIIEPLRNVVSNIGYDHTGTSAFWDEAGHGTAVAGLVVLGEEFLREVKEGYNAKAKVLVIKAIHNTNDDIDIPQLLTDIRDARRQFGVRIFNMSLNLPLAKKYNDTYSQFAYELDKLAYEEDILIFLSVGNFDANSLEDLVINDTHPDHEYPTFFYNLNSSSPAHSCQNTNISEPSESLNNLSVGALAGNLEEGNIADVTPLNLYPAYYSRKVHLDYTQPINTTALKKNQSNKHLNKPDLVFEGGDLFKYEAGMEVLRSPLSQEEKYFGRTCGTSLATPLVTSYAAEILNNYPTLKTQTVKALLINAATYEKKSNLPHFKTSTDTIFRVVENHVKRYIIFFCPKVTVENKATQSSIQCVF